MDTAASPGDPARTGPRVVICGAGIIGCATAYYLAAKGVAATVVEREEPACAASGKAGGFLALDWNDGCPVGPLARLSYGLHRRLARELGEDVGYRDVHTLRVTGSEAAPSSPRAAKRPRRATLLPTWVDGHVSSVTVMGDPSTTSQVHPGHLTRALLNAAVSRGAQLLRGTVTGLQLEGEEGEGPGGEGRARKVTGVLIEGRPDPLPADVVVIAMGPWSDAVRQWLPGCHVPRVTGHKAYSVVLRPEQPLSAHMLFTGIKLASGHKMDPEVYPRPDGTVYVCGEGQDVPLPPSASEVTVDQESILNIRRVAGSLASCLREAPVEVSQSCYLPCAPDSLPVIGPVPGVAGALLATGHTCWGVLNGPATGLLLAEMVAEGRATSLGREEMEAFGVERFARRGPAAAARG